MKLLQSFAEDRKSAGTTITFWVLFVSVLIRLLYANFSCLLPEEAYYWQYAKHLDIGYLDHPPMVALTIFLGTKIFGAAELGVRIGALFWWTVSAVFVYLLSREVFDKKTARASVLLFSILPYFFGVGFFNTPYSPLTAFWAAALYFFFRALVCQQERAWWGVGLCLGLGMLSKYPIALLGLSALVFMILDKKSRHYFLSFRPYFGAIAAFLIFSPVLVWNLEHNWASFTFQSADRLNKPMEFSFHVLLLHIIAVLSPIGAYVFVKGIRGLWRKEIQFFEASQKEANLFIWVFTLVPLLVFALFSLTHEVKVNWTGPVFLAFIPFLGRSLVQGVSSGLRIFEMGWQWTVIVLIAAYLIFLQYVSFGIPGLPYPSNMYKFVTGSNLASQVLQIERGIERTRGERPIVVGMDKHYLASQLGFYREKNRETKEVIGETAGRNLFGRESLMYRFWTKAEDCEGRTMVLISRSSDDLSPTLLRPYFRSLGHMQDLENKKNGYLVGHFYYRVASGYRNAARK